MFHCLWNEPDEVDAVRNIVLSAVFSESEERIEDLCEQVKSDLFAVKTQHTLQNAKSPRDRHDEELIIVDRSFYQVENHGTGNTLIPVVDFKNFPHAACCNRLPSVTKQKSNNPGCAPCSVCRHRR